MQKTLLLVAMSLLMASANARADNLSVPEPAQTQAPAQFIKLPSKGQEMNSVAKEFGEPKVKYPAVGGGQPRQPPITRWDYEDFSVFFEHSHVVDAVIPDRPSEIHHKDELQPAQ